MKDKYRIIKGNLWGYQVQMKPWWFPFCWLNIWWNFMTVDDAEYAIGLVTGPKEKKQLKVIKYIE